MLKAYILTNTLKSGGAEKQSLLLANALRPEFETLLIVYYGSEYDEKFREYVLNNSINVLWLNGSHVSKLVKLYQLFRKNKNSVVFSYLATTNLINGIIGWLSGIKLKIGGIRNEKLSPKKFFIQKFLHNYLLDCTVFNNYKGRESLGSRGFRLDRAKVIHNCIETSLPYLKPVQNEKEIVIASLGRFVEQKDYFTALDAIAILKEQLNHLNSEISIRYHIGGYGVLEDEIRKYITQKGLEQVVNITINPSDISGFLSNAQVFLSTSLFEGLSNSIMEALLYSLPVIATNVGDNEYLVVPGQTGFLAATGDAPAIADALLQLVLGKTLREEMGEKAQSHIRENFSVESFKQKHIHLIQQLNNEKKA